MSSDRLAVHTFRVLGAAALVATIVTSSASADAPIDRFLAQLGSSSGATSEAARLIRENWEACTACDPNEFLTQSRAVLSPPFREGLDAYDADDYERCVARMAALVDDACAGERWLGQEIQDLDGARALALDAVVVAVAEPTPALMEELRMRLGCPVLRLAGEDVPC